MIASKSPTVIEMAMQDSGLVTPMREIEGGRDTMPISQMSAAREIAGYSKNLNTEKKTNELQSIDETACKKAYTD